MLDLFVLYWDLIVKIGAGLIALVPIFIYLKKKWVAPLKNRWDNLNKIGDIYYTLGPNGGKSLYDKIVNIDNRLARAEVRSKSLITALDIAEWQSDINGNCLYVNPAACQLLSRSPEDFLGRNWVNVIHPDDREEVIQEWDQAVKERRTFMGKYRWLHSDGESIRIKAVGHPVFDSGNNLIGWLAVVQPLNN